jgi:hypothetical protein
MIQVGRGGLARQNEVRAGRGDGAGQIRSGGFIDHILGWNGSAVSARAVYADFWFWSPTSGASTGTVDAPELLRAKMFLVSLLRLVL